MPVICVMVRKSTSPIATDKSYRIAYVPAVLVTAGIAVLSLWENPQVPHAMQMSDKLAHGLLYTVLAVAWMAPLAKNGCRIGTACALWAAVTAYGGLMELLQHYCTRTRSGDWADLCADAVGALAGVIIVFLLKKK